MTDDSVERRQTEYQLRQTLQELYRDDLLQLVLEAEGRMVERKDALVDLLDSGVIGPDEYGAKINRVTSVFLGEVANVIGAEACKKMYDFGPDDRIQLVDPRQVRAEPRLPDSVATARIIVGELNFAGDYLHAFAERPAAQRSWLELIRSATATSELAEYFGGTRKCVLCQRAATLSRHLVSQYGGERVDDTAWRVAAQILAMDNWVLDSRPEIRRRFITILRNDPPATLEEWLFVHAREPEIHAWLDVLKSLP